MNFLILEDITLLIEKALRALLLSLCDIVYRLIIIFYDIFIKIGTASILDNPTINEIYRKIGLILGFFMVLRLSFSAITYMVNPDLITDKKGGFANIIKKIIIVIVLLGITPSLFNEAFKLQDYIVKQNIIGKVITNTNDKFDDNQGKNLAWFGFSAFYKPYSDFDGYKVNNHQMSEEDIIKECPTLRDFNEDGIIRRAVMANRDFKFAYKCINTTIDASYGNDDVELFVVDFEGSGIVCFGVGVLLLWLILMYTIQLGVRLLQLAYLQLIAPIPIMMYLTPKGDETLSKWYKQCLTTFLDFFIRTAIMYFAIYIIQFLTDLDSPFMSSFDGLGVLKIYVAVIMIIAILIFAKRVPKLLEEVFPTLKNAASLDFGLKPPKEFKQVGGVVAGAGLGVVGAGVSGISRFNSNKAVGKSTGKSLLGGAYGVGAGLVKGAKSGFTKKGVSGGWKNIQESNNKYNQLITSGGTTLGTIKAKVGDTFGESEGQRFTREMANYQKVIDDNKYVNDIAEEFSEIKQLKTRWETLRMSGAGEDEINAAFKTYKSAKKEALTAALNGKKSFTFDQYFTVKSSDGKRILTKVRPGVPGNISSFEDVALVGQVQVRANATEDFVNSHNVELVDEHGNKITKFNSSNAFKDASVSASNSQTAILKNNDFGAAIANDAAAGVDSHKTERKDKNGGR